ncbi:MAG: dGTP triphosphohydrolase [Verrucomicrobiota bacterium]
MKRGMAENTFYSEFDWASRGGVGKRSDEYRTPFQVNRDRIIHTSAFRRLQSKTQVFWSGEYDFYRTRLTHSIEVAQIGRSICASLRAKSDLLGEDFYIDADLVEAGCLAHDIGHPPFGHTGERTLHRLMREHGGFEGNAQTLRMLTRTIYSAQGRGMDPTRALLDGVLKYKTLYPETPEAKNHFLYGEQGGELDFVFDGKGYAEELAAGKERNGFRSIECQVMDWSDDTAYSINDVADGIQAGFLTLEKLERWGSERELDRDESGHLDYLLGAIREGKVEASLGKKIGDFIAGCRLEETENFMSGMTKRYAYRLVVGDEVEKESALYKRIAFELVFRSPQLQQLDHKADLLLTRLFEVYWENYVGGKGRGWNLLPAAREAEIASAEGEAGKARMVCDHVASMTDGLATRTYRRLFDSDYGSIVDIV